VNTNSLIAVAAPANTALNQGGLVTFEYLIPIFLIMIFAEIHC